jgi:hypothetical protein
VMTRELGLERDDAFGAGSNVVETGERQNRRDM